MEFMDAIGILLIPSPIFLCKGRANPDKRPRGGLEPRGCTLSSRRARRDRRRSGAGPRRDCFRMRLGKSTARSLSQFETGPAPGGGGSHRGRRGLLYTRANGGLGSSEAGDRDAERRAGDVGEAELGEAVGIIGAD